MDDLEPAQQKEVKNLRVSGRYTYRPWPEMRHAARVLCDMADDRIDGRTHVVTASVVLLAFSIEAFCQTLGPEVLTDIWSSNGKKKPAEQFSVKTKLELMARRLKIPLDWGIKPWSHLLDVLEARNELAHPKPNVRNIDVVVQSSGSSMDARDKLHELLDAKYKPMHSVAAIREAAADIDGCLLSLWLSAGKTRSSFTRPGGSVWGMTSVRR